MGTVQALRHMELLIKPPKATKKQERAEIFEIERETVAVTIVGLSPLICNNFSGKSVQQMEDDRGLDAESKAAAKKAPKPPVVPEEKFQLARIIDEKGRDCVLGRWVKAALVTACSRYKEIGIASTVLRGSVYVVGDMLPIQYAKVKAFAPTEQYPQGHKGAGPLLRRDVVRVGNFNNKKPDLRYRPEYRDWSIDLEIQYEPALCSYKALFQLIRRAGTSVGLCEWRPEKSPAGTFGRFDIKGIMVSAR